MSTLVLIDGPNLFNDVDRWFAASVAPHDAIRRQYFRDWFDIDRLVSATIERQGFQKYATEGLGVVVFHSDKPVGRSSVRLVQPEADTFWGRQAQGRGISTVQVTVPGYQPERSDGVCPTCSTSVSLELKTEKGLDTSMVTYLFEAAEQWQEAVLFTNDADFVPPILALRRRGKRVFVAAVDTAGTGALKRACQTFLPIPADFLAHDIALFNFLQPGSKLDEVLAKFQRDVPEEIRLQFKGVTASGPSPLLWLHNGNGYIENFFTENLGGESVVRWQPAQKQGAFGVLMPAKTGSFGAAVQRRLNLFAGAEWFKLWQDIE